MVNNLQLEIHWSGSIPLLFREQQCGSSCAPEPSLGTRLGTDCQAGHCEKGTQVCHLRLRSQNQAQGEVLIWNGASIQASKCNQTQNQGEHESLMESGPVPTAPSPRGYPTDPRSWQVVMRLCSHRKNCLQRIR